MKQFILCISFVISISQFAIAQMPWYHHTTIYQIYPRSFYDSNGDGIGDIQGIIQKLDYIKSIGYETIWCSPFFKSPQLDFGYDISDYCDIAPEYGTLADAQQLIDEAHKRGMKIVFDMVMNHTSNEHPWFKEDLLRKPEERNQTTDNYIWKDKQNAWKSTLKKKGWHYSPERNQFYWASFLSFQPDLNYRNPKVKKQMFENVKFWLAKGVDGFRLDMFNSIYKDEEFRNNTASRNFVSTKYNTKGFKSTIKGYVNQPESFDFAKELRNVCDTFGERMLLGEVFGDHAMIKNFVGKEKNDGLGLVFNFEMLRFKFNANYFHKTISGLEKDFSAPFAPVYVFSNHDRRRSMKRLNGNIAKAKLLHVLQLTTRGVACMYYGEETGMTDVRMPYKKALDPIPHLYKGIPRFLVDLAGETMNRDELRTPMQWNSSKNAGFSTAEKTWLPAHTNFTNVNVEKERSDENSLLKVVQQVLKIRKEMPAIHSGTLELISKGTLPSNVLAFKRKMDGEEVLVVLNFSKAEKEIALTENFSNVLFSSSANEKLTEGKIHLSAYGTMILKK